MIAMRPRKVRRLFGLMALGALLAAAVIFAAGVAKADPADETATAICSSLDEYPTVANVSRLVTVLVAHGFTPYAAGAFIADSVLHYCSRHIPVLEAFTEQYAPTPVGGRVA